MSTRCDVLVVGAGPVGLCLACTLRRAGRSVRLIDVKTGPSLHSKAIGLQHRVSEVLARLGVVERFIARGGSPTVVRIYEGSRTLVTLRFSTPPNISGRDAFEPRPILLPQSDTEHLLIERLGELGGEVEWRSEFLSYTEGPGGIIATVRDLDGVEHAITADWLVGCDGAHSRVRRQAGLSFEGKTYPLAFLLVDVKLDTGLEHGENHVWVSRQGSLALLPLPAAGTWRIFVDVTGEPAVASDPAGLLGWLERLANERAPGLQLRPVGEPLWVSDFRLNCRMVDPMQVGRVFAAGDAAHIHSPTGGQGITTGMQDAANLAWKLDRVLSGAPVELLDTYSEERVPQAREVLAETDRTTTLVLAPAPALRVIRDLFVLPLLNSRRLQQRMFGKFSQLHVHYRASSLSKTSTKTFGPGLRRRAGDRAPDVSFLRLVSGRPTTLFELLGESKPVVLLVGLSAERLVQPLCDLELTAYLLRRPDAVEVNGTGGSVLIDRHGDFERLYGRLDEGLWLIRPDGHIGLCQRPIDVSDLEEYLMRICSPIKLEGFLARVAPAPRASIERLAVSEGRCSGSSALRPGSSCSVSPSC